MRQKSAVEKTTSDYERYEKNRRRRLLKEKSRRASPSAPPPESRIQVTTAVASSSHEKILKCKECQQEIYPPYQMYVCHNNHLHTERVGGQQPNIKVFTLLLNLTLNPSLNSKANLCTMPLLVQSLSNSIASQSLMFLICFYLVLLYLFWTFSVQNEIFKDGVKRKTLTHEKE